MFDIINLVMTWLEHNLLIAILAAVVAANVLLVVAMALYVKLNAEQRLALHKVVYEIDRACDDLEDPATRAKLILQAQQVLGWKRVFLPTAILQWIIAGEVALIRKAQQQLGVPDLHQTEKEVQNCGESSNRPGA